MSAWTGTFWEADSSSASQKTPRLLRNLKVYYSKGAKYTVEYTLYGGTEYFQHSFLSIPTNA